MSIGTRRSMQASAARLVCSTGPQQAAWIEPLEGRLLMTTVVVNSPTDKVRHGNLITLRDAIAIANASTEKTKITFDPTVFATPQTIVLDSLEFTMASAKKTVIEGPAAGVTINAQHLSRIFHILPTATVTLSGLTLTGAVGSAINNAGTLKMTNSTFTQNGGGNGAGFFNIGVATLTNVTVSHNSAAGFDGAGIFNRQNATLNLTNDTLSDNSGLDGAGLFNSGKANLINVTVYGNSALLSGGGVYSSSTGSMSMTNVTIVNNGAVNNFGGGVYNDGGGVSFANTIIAGNFNNTANKPNNVTVDSDLKGTFLSKGSNLVGIGNLGGTGDQGGNVAVPLDPMLSGLADHGGKTLTLVPLAGSPVIDAGSNASVFAGIVNDQRGRARINNLIVDIGSVEYYPRVRVPQPLP